MNRFIVLVTFLFSNLFFSFSSADSIQTFFNHNENHSYVDPYYHRQRIGDNLEDVLLSAINNAQQSISIAVYELDLPRVAQALVKKRKLGVKINIILENENSKIWKLLPPDSITKLDPHGLMKYKEFVAFADLNNDGVVSYDEQTQADSLLILKNGGISWIDDTADGSSGSGLMHHKFMIVDGRVLITGTSNFTRSCVHGDKLHPLSKGNANSFLRIESQAIITFFQQEFNEMFTLHHFGTHKSYRGPRQFNINGSSVTIQFSPTDKNQNWSNSTNGLIVKQFLTARESSDLALFVFSEQRIVDAMQAAHEKGMANRTIIEPSFATRYYSELLDIFGLEMKSEKCGIEPGNKPWRHPSLKSGIANLDEGDVLHHKFAVIDQRKVLVGSHNWSEAANSINDEAFFVIDDAKIANDYSHEFEGLYRKATVGVPSWLTQKIDNINQQCGN